MLGGQLGPEVADLVQQWTPSEVYDHERKYQTELQEYLDNKLNSGSGGVGISGGRTHAVSTERGTSRGDIVIDDRVGIELKRDFSNSQKRKLRGQLEDYAENHDFVIACACGVQDFDGWREVENKFSEAHRGVMDTTQFQFIVKRRENFGQGSRDSRGGMFGDEGLF